MSIVYILTNESMPDYIKIGRTEREVTKRVLELDNTAVPLPFQCYYAAEVADYQKVEKALHGAFGDYRVRKNREFFRALDPHKVKMVLELLATSDVTPRDDFVIDADTAQALERAEATYTRRFSFKSAGVPLGETLVFARNDAITCTVVTDSTVMYEGTEVSISRAAVLASQSLGFKSKELAGGNYWLFENETVNLRRTRLQDLRR